MGIHSPSDAEQPESADGLVAIVVGIANKAAEGQIVVSQRIRNAVPAGAPVQFREREDQLELVSDEAILEEPLFDVVSVFKVRLSDLERKALFEQPEETKHRGGFQAFLVGLQKRVHSTSNELNLTISDRERIARYAHDYKGGGWQGKLRKIFGGTLGSNLGRLK